MSALGAACVALVAAVVVAGVVTCASWRRWGAAGTGSAWVACALVSARMLTALAVTIGAGVGAVALLRAGPPGEGDLAIWLMFFALAGVVAIATVVCVLWAGPSPWVGLILALLLAVVPAVGDAWVGSSQDPDPQAPIYGVFVATFAMGGYVGGYAVCRALWARPRVRAVLRAHRATAPAGRW